MDKSECRAPARLIGAALIVSACAGRPAAAEGAGDHLRPEAECAAVRAGITAAMELHGASLPVVRALRLPAEAPPHLRGRTLHVHLVVDENGRVVPGSVHVEGSDDAEYNQKVSRAAENWTFRPARFEGCTIAHPFTWTLKAAS
jgi:TonB family protein